MVLEAVFKILIFNPISCGIFLFIISYILVKKFINIAHKFNIIDSPNNRSSHIYPVARGGGIVIAVLTELLLIALCLLNYLSCYITCILSCAFIVAILGFIDDISNLSIKIRLLIQLIASILAVNLVRHNIDFCSLNNIIIFIFLVLIIVWCTNLFNFMDGTDGFAATEAIFILISGGILLIRNNIFLGNVLLLVASIILGLLILNFPPAKIFMGDVGSYFLGFLISVVVLISYYFYKIPLLFWLIISAVFYFDATITLFKRIVCKEEWYLPHRSHAYQRLQNIGWNHRDILCGLIILNIFLSTISFIAYYLDLLLFANIVVFILLAGIYIFISIKEEKNEKSC